MEQHWTMGSILLNWKNNCCEAINHILKMEFNWTPHKLPDMIHKIQRIVNLQFADVRRALHGQGNFQLVPQCQHFQISHTSWVSKTNTEKDKAYVNFMTSGQILSPLLMANLQTVKQQSSPRSHASMHAQKLQKQHL